MAEVWLLDLLRAAVNAGERVLVGLDFPYGYPAGFAAMLGVAGEPWRGVWAYLERCIEDDERNATSPSGPSGIRERRSLTTPLPAERARHPGASPPSHLQRPASASSSASSDSAIASSPLSRSSCIRRI